MEEVPQETQVIPDFQENVLSYFPIYSSLRVNTDFTHTQLQRDIDDKISKTKQLSDDFINEIADMSPIPLLELCREFLESQTESYTKLVETKFRLQTLQTALRHAHSAVVDTRRLEDDLTLENYIQYCELTKENFADAIIADVETKIYSEQGCSTILKADSWYQYIRNCYFVLEHPEDPLPDDQVDEELAVEGGKISLKDPFSLNYFVEPLMAISCKHVFEKEHIMGEFRDSPRTKCPITGCVAELTKKDLRPDLLMQLRVRVHKAKEKNKSQSRATRLQ